MHALQLYEILGSTCKIGRRGAGGWGSIPLLTRSYSWRYFFQKHRRTDAKMIAWALRSRGRGDGVYGDLGTHSDREREEIRATAEHRVSGEGNSSRVLPNPSGSPKRRPPDTRRWRKWVGSSIHAILGVSQSALVRAQMLLMSTEQSTSTSRKETEANSYPVHSARHCS